LKRATEFLLKAFGDMFGGATAMPCLGTWQMLDGSGLAVEAGQTLVVSEVGDLLEQEGMAVIAYTASDGFLLVPELPTTEGGA